MQYRPYNIEHKYWIKFKKQRRYANLFELKDK